MLVFVELRELETLGTLVAEPVFEFNDDVEIEVDGEEDEAEVEEEDVEEVDPVPLIEPETLIELAPLFVTLVEELTVPTAKV